MLRAGDRIPEEALSRTVAGVNLSPGTLRDQLGDALLLLVFLRHFGCIFCRETLADLRAAAEADERFPEPFFFFQGTSTEGRAFLRRSWPGVRAVADPEGALYDAFGIGRGGVVKMFQPAVWRGKARAEAKGHRNGERSGDIWRMPGVFLTRGTEVLWAHEYRHAADQPDFGRIAEQAAGIA